MSIPQTYKRKQLIVQLALRDGYICHYCGIPLVESVSGYNPNGASLDHVVAVDNGGTDDLSNLLLACRQCNGLKKTKHYQEFKMMKDTDMVILFLMGGEE